MQVSNKFLMCETKEDIKFHCVKHPNCDLGNKYSRQQTSATSIMLSRSVAHHFEDEVEHVDNGFMETTSADRSAHADSKKTSTS